jgi:hypothetical protein
MIAHSTSGLCYPFPVAELGFDHFLLDRHIDVATVALTTTVISWIEQRRSEINHVTE